MNNQFEIDTCKCPYKVGDKIEDSPHIHEPFRPIPKLIYDDVLDAVGNTPMVRINKVGKDNGVNCELLAKCQFMNMGGSVKDRIGKRMVLDAEKRGILKPGMKIVEATSGNTGIGLALASAVRGYECIICMPEKMSAEKANVLKGLGAHIIRTPTEASWDSPDSHLSVSKDIVKNDEKAILLDQYVNPSNPIAHYDQLAEEILYQCGGKLDAVVVGTGTGGTMAGIARKIKQKSPNTITVAADPYGSILAIPGKLNEGDHKPNKVEGIGYDFVPRTCIRTEIDFWVKTDDPESFKNSRDLIRKEGLLVGGSAGSITQAAFEFIKQKGWENDATKRIVCVYSDSIRNYLTKFLSAEWCVECGFLPYENLNEEGHIFSDKKIEELNLQELKTFEDITVKEAKDLFAAGAKIIPFKNAKGEFFGALFARKFIELVNLKKLKADDSALKAKTNEYVVVPNTLTVVQLEKLLERNEAVIVVTKDGQNNITKVQVASIYDTMNLV